MDPKVIGLVAHSGKAGAAELVGEILADLEEFNLQPLLESETAGLIGRKDGLPVPELATRCDLILVLGGDGSLLRVARQLRENACPLMGINLGSLGFLTCVSSNDHRKAVEAVAQGAITLTRRSMLRVEKCCGGETDVFHALNDCVVSRGEASRLVHLEVRIDSDVLATYHADGLIIATSTGSTAYSMSAGGPIIFPGSGVFVITPICPHALTNRSVVVSDRSVIEIIVRHQQESVFLTTDGQQSGALAPGDVVRIRAANHRVALAMLPELSFGEVLRAKLRWSGSSI